MIWLIVVLYFILGFAFLLVGQISHQKGYDLLDYFDLIELGDTFEFRLMAMMTVIFWPAITVFFIIILFIPWIITFLYKLFVGIIFGTIALFKKEKEKDGLE